MATDGDTGRLTPRQIVRLARTISADKMAAIAEGYMGIDEVTIKHTERDTTNSEAFNREIIKLWANKNAKNQAQNLAALLYEATEECGYLDPNKVQQILGVTRQEAAVPRQPEVTKDELLNLAEDLRPHTSKRMKMEPAPWIKDYVVDMEELYTELTLEKIDDKLFQQEHIQLENYKELFAWHNPGMFEYFNIIYYLPDWSPTRRILVKGEPGMGKTSLMKKIAWDWSKRLFVKVSIVFFVFLKLVKPGDFVEDAIIHQNHALQGKHVTEKKLNNFLESYGHECLLILDGLDECALGQNNEVLKIITGSKFINCNVLLTSRPHSIKGLDIYFDTIISVEGFTRNEARKFASRIVPDGQKVDQILNFNPAGERANRPVQNVPILLSFLCLLVREENIDLSDKTTSMGEIYFRMVRCLYKKFTIRKGIEFETSSFFKVLESLGKFALDTLLSGNTLLQRSQIAAEVGSDVFDYGLLIGHEDFRLIRDETADIFVTFPHRSILEFLGAFFFVLSLMKKRRVNHVDKAFQEFLKNPLFAEFCLWILDESNRFFSFPERSVAIELLSSYVAEQIDDVEVDFMKLEKKYPALGLALNKKNKMALTILDLAVTKCRKIEHLSIDTRHLIGILRSLQPIVFEQIKSIKVDEWIERSQPRKKDAIRLIPEEIPLLFVRSYHDPNFNIEVTVGELCSETSWESLDTVLKFTECWRRSVYLRLWWYLNKRLDPSLLHRQWPSVHTLDCSHGLVLSDDNFFGMLQNFPQLVKLFLNNSRLRHGWLSRLASIASQGRFSKLSTLDISNNRNVGGNLENVLCSSFPTLDTLLLNYCDLDSRGLSTLARVSANGRLPKLSTLDISNNPDIGGNLEDLLCSSFESLGTLLLNSCCLSSYDLSSLAHASVTGRLPKLTTLDISNNPDIGGNLSVLFYSTSFPSLHSLFVSKCELNRSDISSLIEAREQALPQLKNLDVSFYFKHHLCSHSKSNSSSAVLCILPGLNNLVARDCDLEYNDLFHTHQRAITDGDYFSDLTTLDMTRNPDISGSLSLLMRHYCPKLNILILRNCELNSGNMMSLSRASSQGRLPELRHLDISQNNVGCETGTLFILFGGLRGFPSLINLILSDCGLDLLDLCCLTQAKLDGKLPRIRHLDISLNELSDHVGILSRDPITQCEINWGNIICYD